MVSEPEQVPVMETGPGVAPITVTVAMLGVPIATVVLTPLNYNVGSLDDELESAVELYSKAPPETVEAAVMFLRAAAEQADPALVMRPT